MKTTQCDHCAEEYDVKGGPHTCPGSESIAAMEERHQRQWVELLFSKTVEAYRDWNPRGTPRDFAEWVERSLEDAPW